MSALEPGIYKAILAVKPARAFDAGGLLMRLYYYMSNVGVITMLTLSGYSFFLSGLVSSTIALAVFLVSPRIAKLIDERGQRAVVPKAACLPVLGTAGMLACVLLHGPDFALFPLAVLMGSGPAPQALVRARWTYLVRTGKLGKTAPSLHGVFSYEAVLDDVGFMFSPALSIFLASSITPVAGMAFGAAAYALGAALLTLSRSTEPIPGWTAADSEEDEGAERDGITQAAASEGTAAEGAAGPRTAAPHTKSIFRTSPVVRILFAMMFFLGAFFGALDTNTVAFAEEAGEPNIASAGLMLQALMSVIMGFIFGMIRLPLRQSTQLVLTAVLFGCAWACSAFVHSVPSFFLITIPASIFYAPFLITVNATCEGAVPGSRFTEAITWVNAGTTCGMTLGPSLAGAIVDSLGTLASFKVAGVIAAMTAVVALVFRRTLHRNVH